MVTRSQAIINDFQFLVTQDRRLIKAGGDFGECIEQVKDVLNPRRGISKIVLTTRLGSPK